VTGRGRRTRAPLPYALPVDVNRPAERPLPADVDRREVLRSLGLLTLAGGAAAWGVLPRVAWTDPGEGAAGRGKSLDAAAWKAVSALTDTLFPTTPDGPGATEVNAVGYVDALLADRDVAPAEVAHVRTALARADALARERGATGFGDAPPADRQAVVRALFSDDSAMRGTRLLLSYTLEAAFGDPVYGGNPGRVGWKWIGYRAPDPRPTKPWHDGGRR
jgi:hypothetical protein